MAASILCLPRGNIAGSECEHYFRVRNFTRAGTSSHRKGRKLLEVKPACTDFCVWNFALCRAGSALSLESVLALAVGGHGLGDLQEGSSSVG
ncbi:MAG TPA: hypothetical protein VN807_00190, partial [Candidatus Sulfotelmatobacter sp.]|nr:hypothetical protein [Candidatus Sulfotelmatobacter sp.]